MNVLRFLRPACIRLGLATRPIPPPEEIEETEAQLHRRQWAEKEAVMAELAELATASGEVVNPTRFHKDLVFREKRATTAILPGVALPHVRSLQIRSFVMGFARADGDGLWYGSQDGQPTRLFFLLAAPPYDDRAYLAVYREVAQLLDDEETVAALQAATAVNEVFNVLRRFFR